MNRGFATYFGGGIKASAKTIYKNKGLLFVWLYTVMELIGRITLIFAPVFDLANIRQAKIAHADNEATLAENFRNALRGRSLWAYVGACALEALIFLGGIILIGIFTGLLALLGLIVSYAAIDFPQEYMMLIFCAPGMLALVVYFVMMPIFFAPTPYIVESNPGIGAAAAVSASLKSMRRCGKWTCFLNAAIPALIVGLILGVCVGANLLIDAYFFGSVEGIMIQCAVTIVCGIAFLLIAPIFHLTYKIAEKSLFEDIALDPVNAGKHTSGVNIKKCKGVLFAPETIEENLAVLFDETENDSVPLPSSGARIKREKSARAGMKKADLSDTDKNENSDRQEQR